MDILINQRGKEPIYSQIETQIRDQIMDGTLAEDFKLPSMRALAKDLQISLITTKRVYEDLESEGLIYTVPGKGSYVARRDSELIREENLKQIEEALQLVHKLADQIDLDDEEVIALYQSLKEEKS